MISLYHVPGYWNNGDKPLNNFCFERNCYRNANLLKFAEMLKIAYFYLSCPYKMPTTKTMTREVIKPSMECPKECTVIICLVELEKCNRQFKLRLIVYPSQNINASH